MIPRETGTTWHTLYTTALALIDENREHVSLQFLEGLDILGYSTDACPSVKEVSALLTRYTGWRLAPVEGMVADEPWYIALSERTLPVNTIVRQPEHIASAPVPDMFHEFFGHIPLTAVQPIADLQERFGAAYVAATSQQQRDAIAALFHYSIEFGLMVEQGTPRLFGAGLYSSSAMFAQAITQLEQGTMSQAALDEIIISPVSYLGEPERLFVFTSINQVNDMLDEIHKMGTV